MQATQIAKQQEQQQKLIGKSLKLVYWSLTVTCLNTVFHLPVVLLYHNPRPLHFFFQSS